MSDPASQRNGQRSQSGLGKTAIAGSRSKRGIYLKLQATSNMKLLVM